MKSPRLGKHHMLVVVGVPGSGKTFFASQFSKMFHIPYIHYETIQYATEQPLSEDDTASFAGILFHELAKTGESIIVEGPGSSRVERTALVAQAQKYGYEALFVWVQTEPTTTKQRAVHGVRGSGYQTISEADYTREASRFTNLNATEQFVVISGKQTYVQQARNVLKRIVSPDTKARVAAPIPPRPASQQRPGRISIN